MARLVAVAAAATEGVVRVAVETVKATRAVPRVAMQTAVEAPQATVAEALQGTAAAMRAAVVRAREAQVAAERPVGTAEAVAAVWAFAVALAVPVVVTTAMEGEVLAMQD
jgi:hypothetical protein